ncbi:DMT family transporter [Mycobacterium sp. MBM]|nr:DMT family transporter [Mycobacterium sp. MBM]
MIDQLLVVVFALCAAIFAAVGIVVRQRATIDVPAEHGVSTVMLATLLRRPLWWAGTAAAVAGFVFQALALDNGSLIVVQPLLVSALLFALPLSARLAHRRVTRGDWLWAVLLTVSLAIFVLLAHPRVNDQVAPVTTIAVVAGVCAAVVLGCVLVAVRRSGWQRAVPLAVAVGVLFGLVAVLTKMLMHALDRESVAEVLATPLPYALVLLGVLATLLQQSAFHAGSLQTSVPTMLVVEPMAAVLLGVFLLGETLTANRWEAMVLTVAVVAMTAATIALGRDEGAYEAELEATSRGI